jgi:hypothetical protein
MASPSNTPLDGRELSAHATPILQHEAIGEQDVVPGHSASHTIVAPGGTRRFRCLQFFFRQQYHSARSLFEERVIWAQLLATWKILCPRARFLGQGGLEHNAASLRDYHKRAFARRDHQHQICLTLRSTVRERSILIESLWTARSALADLSMHSIEALLSIAEVHGLPRCPEEEEFLIEYRLLEQEGNPTEKATHFSILEALTDTLKTSTVQTFFTISRDFLISATPAGLDGYSADRLIEFCNLAILRRINGLSFNTDEAAFLSHYGRLHELCTSTQRRSEGWYGSRSKTAAQTEMRALSHGGSLTADYIDDSLALEAVLSDREAEPVKFSSGYIRSSFSNAEIARGAFGVVHLARDARLDIEFVVKQAKGDVPIHTALYLSRLLRKEVSVCVDQ